MTQTANRARLSAILSSACLFLAVAPGQAAFDAWSTKMPITFNYRDFEPLTNFPVLIVLGPSRPGFSYSQFSSAQGADLRFADSAGNELPYEIEQWNTSGNSYVWVRLPKLLGNGNTNYFDGQWLNDWSWNGQTQRARKHSNNQLYAEKIEQNNYMAYWSFKAQGSLVGPPYMYLRDFALGDPRTGWVWPHPLQNFTQGQHVATFTYSNPTSYEQVEARFANGYWYPWSTTGNRFVYNGELPQDKSDFFSSYAADERAAQGAFFADFNPLDPNNPSWAYNYTNDTSWVGVQNTQTGLTSITAYWGNSSATAQPYLTNGTVWTANYVGVWHMGQSNAFDSTRRIANGTPTSVATATGKAGDALTFSGSSKVDFGTVNIGFSGHTEYSVEAWVKRTSVGSGPDVSYGNSGSGQSFSIGTDGSGNYRNIHHFSQSEHTYSRAYANGQWEHIVFNYYPNNRDVSANDYTEHMFINSDWVACAGRVGSTDLANVPSSGPLKFGQESWGSANCGSLTLDEVRISKTVRMYNWQRNSYLTVASNSTFTTYGTITEQVPPVIPSGSTWLYDNHGTLPDVNWTSRTFTDSGWSSGAAPLGYASDSPQIATTLSYGGDVNNRWISYYFRKHFTLTNASAVTGMIVNLQYDDGAAIYVNGTLVASTNLPGSWGNATPALSAAPESAGTYTWFPFPISTNPLVTGDNVIAVEIHQNSTNSSDVYFDLSLDTGGSGASLPPVQTNPAPAISNWTAYNDCAWKSDDATDVTSAYTTNNPGGLTSGTLVAETGETLTGVTVNMTTSGSGFNHFAISTNVIAWPTGVDATLQFAGKIGKGYVCEIQGTDAVVTVDIAGLQTTKQYRLVVWSSRLADSSAYSNRLTDVTLSSMASFINSSTIADGVSRFTSAMTDDGTTVRAAFRDGYAPVVRFDQIRTGVDGAITFKVRRNAASAGNAYLNAFKLVESSVTTGTTDVDSDGMDDTWEQSYFGSTNVLPNADADGDGLSNFQEYIAGCQPQNASSFPMMNLGSPSGSGLGIDVTTVTQRLYNIDIRTQLVGGTWQSYTSFLGNGSTIAFTNSTLIPHAYYRFRVSIAP